MKIILPLPLLVLLTLACNTERTNEKKETNSPDSTLQTQDTAIGSRNITIPADTATSGFLVRAAETGWVEAAAGNAAMAKATTSAVKNFASIIAHDHMEVNEKIRMMAAQRGITLPPDTPQNKMKIMDKISKEKGRAFDKAYMDMMISDHREALHLFESSKSVLKDEEVKNFIINVIPKLNKHLDSAQSIAKRLEHR